MWIVALGSGCLGVLIGILVCWYIVDVERLNLGALTGAVTTLAGAGVIAVFHLVGDKTGPADPQYWWYPVGLLIGFLLTAAVRGTVPRH